MTESEYKRYLKNIAKERKLIAKHTLELRQLLELCPHLDRVKKSQYFDGSYYDKASTAIWVQCNVCGQMSDKKTETHSWYG